MRALVVVAVLCGCGQRASVNGAAPSDGANGVDASHGDGDAGDLHGGDANANGDGGTSGTTDGGASTTDAGGSTTDGSASMTDGGGSVTGDAGGSTTCAAPIAPSVTISVSVAGNSGFVFRAGDKIIANSVLDPAHQWLRWTGAAWNAEPIPWPTNLPSNHPNYVGRVVPLADKRVLIVTDSYWLTIYDGTTMLPATAPAPTPSQEMWGYAADASSTYHVFWGSEEWISKPDGSWYPPSPVPVQSVDLTQNISSYDEGAAAIMADGRVVVLYVDDKFDAPAEHAWITSHGTNETWTQPMDITTNWAVNAKTPALYAPPGGGIVASVVGQSNNYNVGAIWRSANGTSFGAYENVGADAAHIAGDCLDSLVAAAGPSLLRSYSSGWDTLAGHAPTVYHSEVAALPDGHVFWVVGTGTGTDYLVSP